MFDETGCLKNDDTTPYKKKITVTIAAKMQLAADESHRRLSNTLNISASPVYLILK